MNIILLSISIILLLIYMLFLARRKDFLLLKIPPKTQVLSRTKYEQALKQLNQFKKLPKPKSQKALVEHNSEQFYLERRLYQIQQETDNEQKSYYLACKERDIAWQDYRDYFDRLSPIEKYIIPAKIRELIVLRNLYLDSEKKVDLELNKFSARSRVRHYEETGKQQRDAEIERKTQEQDGIDIPDQQNDLSDESTLEVIETNALKPTSESNSSAGKANDNKSTEFSVSPAFSRNVRGDNHFSQEEFNEKFPDFKNLTFIDETLSITELSIPLVQDANFDSAYFVSVTFKDRHQYKNCSFKNADFSYSKWQRAEKPHRILGSDFSGAKFNFAQLDFVAFYNCNFEYADFQDAQFQLVKFVNCNFDYCNIAGVDLSKTVMSADMLESIDFSQAISPPKNSPSDQAAATVPQNGDAEMFVGKDAGDID